jgi:hypothetical protein
MCYRLTPFKFLDGFPIILQNSAELIQLFCQKMPNDALTVGVVKYAKIMQWLIPLSIIVPFLAFIIAGEDSSTRYKLMDKLLTWFYPLLFGGFVISIPFVFIEHKNSGFRCLATAIVTFLVLFNYPTEKHYDGCSCGLRRSWYHWRGQKLKLTIDKQGDPNHRHRIWDPQYVFSPYTPW